MTVSLFLYFSCLEHIEVRKKLQLLSKAVKYTNKFVESSLQHRRNVAKSNEFDKLSYHIHSTCKRVNYGNKMLLWIISYSFIKVVTVSNIFVNNFVIESHFSLNLFLLNIRATCENIYHVMRNVHFFFE